ncbi:MAG: nicotinate (nicotinamide) nucleotide adenylyltransferase [SAR324 cluster bacterium]|nr:nicotinate (nicotinamide) nucleotide adenylyltransferase [SAR324 cluster bacterium]
MFKLMQPHYAIFGGSFNPIHRGHVAVVEHLLKLEVDKVVVIPTSRSPFKLQEQLLPNALRMEMVRHTFQEWEKVIISDIEIKTHQVQYTYHTLKHLHIQYPRVIWHLVVGWDAYQDFPKWKEAKQIINSTTLWIVQRSDLSLQQKESVPKFIMTPTLARWFEGIEWNPKKLSASCQGQEVVRYLEIETPPISSTDIRSGRAGLEWIPSKAKQLYLEFLNKP